MPATSRKTYRYEKFEEMLSSATIDIAFLRQLSWSGIPPKFRATTWQILLGYLPANASRRASSLKRKRDHYYSFAFDKTEKNNAALQVRVEVKADVPRTAPMMGLFRDENVQNSLERLLITWAIRNSSVSYVQGMADIVAIIFYVFIGGYFKGKGLESPINVSDEVMLQVEADSYWCFSIFMSRILDLYTPGQPGIKRMILRLERIVHRVEFDLSSHLKAQKVPIMHFSFRWMNCLLYRELPFSCVIRLWDTYLSELHLVDFHVYVCAAYLSHYAEKLKTMEYEGLYTFWQKSPSSGWGVREVEDLVSRAFIWQSLFSDCEAHLEDGTMVRTKASTKKEVHVHMPVCLMGDSNFLCYP